MAQHGRSSANAGFAQERENQSARSRHSNVWLWYSSSPTRTKAHSICPVLTLHTEHVQRLMDHDQETTNNCVQHYKAALRAIYDDVPLIAQISKSLNGSATAATINTNYLCLQCPIVIKEADMPTHGKQKSHRFCMLPGNLINPDISSSLANNCI